jgi:hypothetical protein
MNHLKQFESNCELENQVNNDCRHRSDSYDSEVSDSTSREESSTYFDDNDEEDQDQQEDPLSCLGKRRESPVSSWGKSKFTNLHYFMARRVANQALLKFLLKYNLPLAVIEDPAFLSIIKAVHNESQ